MSLHAAAWATLREWSAPDAAQEQLRERYVAHLAAHRDGLDRDCRPDHLTAGVLVVSDDARQVLLTLHAKAHRWFQFGGHCEPGDASLAAAALREATEESGLSGLALDPSPIHLDEHVVAFCGDTPDTHHLDVRFLARAPARARPITSEESIDVRWWPVDDLPESDLAGLVEHALVRLRHP